MKSERAPIISKEQRRDPFEAAIRASQQLPEAGTYNLKDTFEQNKGKAATFGASY